MLSVPVRVFKNVTLHIFFPSSLKTVLFCRLDFCRLIFVQFIDFPTVVMLLFMNWHCPFYISNFPITLKHFLLSVLGNYCLTFLSTRHGTWISKLLSRISWTFSRTVTKTTLMSFFSLEGKMISIISLPFPPTTTNIFQD